MNNQVVNSPVACIHKGRAWRRMQDCLPSLLSLFQFCDRVFSRPLQVFHLCCNFMRAFLVWMNSSYRTFPSGLVVIMAQLVKNPPAMQKTWVWSLGWEDPLEKEKAMQSSILAWRIPCPWDHRELDMTVGLSLSLYFSLSVVKNPPASAGDARDLGLIAGLKDLLV